MIGRRRKCSFWRGAALIAAAASLFCCQSTIEQKPRELFVLKSGPFEIETEIADPEVHRRLIQILERVSLGLHTIFADRFGDIGPLRVRLLDSEAERWVDASLVSGREIDVSRAIPASASRRTFRATVAMPRADVIYNKNTLADLFIPDSVAATIAHEATHLWIFKNIKNEADLPPWVHEGVAEFVARSAVGAGLFERESVPELLRARDRGELPTLEELFTIDPKESRSPQLWTAAAWWHIRSLASEGSPADIQNAIVYMLEAGGDRDAAREYYISHFGDRAFVYTPLESENVEWWSVGRDVSRLRAPSTPESVAPISFLLAPIPGKGVWNFKFNEMVFSEFNVEADVTVLGGGSPELWFGFGFDDGGNGVRLSIPASGLLTIERVIDGLPHYGYTEDIGASPLGNGGPVHVDVRREGRRLRVEIGPRRAVISLPRDVDIPRGRFGVGAKGGAFTVRALSIGPG